MQAIWGHLQLQLKQGIDDLGVRQCTLKRERLGTKIVFYVVLSAVHALVGQPCANSMESQGTRLIV